MFDQMELARGPPPEQSVTCAPAAAGEIGGRFLTPILTRKTPAIHCGMSARPCVKTNKFGIYLSYNYQLLVPIQRKASLQGWGENNLKCFKVFYDNFSSLHGHRSEKFTTRPFLLKVESCTDRTGTRQHQSGLHYLEQLRSNLVECCPFLGAQLYGQGLV